MLGLRSLARPGSIGEFAPTSAIKSLPPVAGRADRRAPVAGAMGLISDTSFPSLLPAWD